MSTERASVHRLHAEIELPLRGIDLALELEVESGRCLALVGRSGAGKSSTLRALAGLLSPARGRIGLDGEAWFDSARALDLPPERRRCGLVFQDYALFPRMSAWRNVAYGAPGPRRERRRQAVALLERFGAGALADAPPERLSGGERQRVALARALAARPRALLLDEPLSALDPTTRAGAVRRLRELLAELEAPALLVTHAFDEAALLADEVAVLEGGAIVQAGSPAEISARPRTPFVADLAGAAVLRGVAAVEPGGVALVRLEGGGEVRSVDAARGPVAVSVFPWEVSLEPPGRAPRDSVLNRLAGEVESVTTVGNRARVALLVPQRLSVEVTARSAAAMGLRPGSRVVAAWKASATRLIELDG